MITTATIIAVVQSLSHVQLFETPWTAALQAFLSFSVFRSLLRLVSIQSVMLFNHLILCCSLLLLPSVFPRVFSMSQLFTSGGQSFSISPSNEYSGSICFRMTGLILRSKGLPRVFFSPTMRKQQFFGTQPSLRSNYHIHA